MHCYIFFFRKYLTAHIHRVISPAAQWPEWMTSVPLLFYIAISCDASRSSLNTVDISILVAMTLTILCGFLLNIRSAVVPQWVFCMLLFISCCGVLSVFVLAFSTEKQLVTQIRNAKTLDSITGNFEMTPRERLVYVQNQFKRLHYTMKKVLLQPPLPLLFHLFTVVQFIWVNKGIHSWCLCIRFVLSFLSFVMFSCKLN